MRSRVINELSSCQRCARVQVSYCAPSKNFDDVEREVFDEPSSVDSLDQIGAYTKLFQAPLRVILPLEFLEEQR